MEGIYKIIKIIDAYSIVINGGSNDDLILGTQLEIFAKGEEIIDPDTKESLGTLDLVKERIEITTILPKMSICKNIEEKQNSFAVLLAGAQKTYEAKQLYIDSTEISGGFENIVKKIKVGDLVRRAL